MNAEEMIKVWAARKLNVDVDSIEAVEFKHEDSFVNDSGTWWPEENDAVVTIAFEGKNGQTHRKKRVIPLPEGIEGFQSILQEILEAN